MVFDGTRGGVVSADGNHDIGSLKEWENGGINLFEEGLLLFGLAVMSVLVGVFDVEEDKVLGLELF